MRQDFVKVVCLCGDTAALVHAEQSSAGCSAGIPLRPAIIKPALHLICPEIFTRVDLQKINANCASSQDKRCQNSAKMAAGSRHEIDLATFPAPIPVTPLWRARTPLHANDLNHHIFY
jgi:hypothetical protein